MQRSRRHPSLAEATATPEVPVRLERPRPMRELSAILAIAQRDLTKLIRDRTRLIADLAFPIIFIGILGPALQASFGGGGVNLVPFIFTGVLAQTIWQSAAMGVISLIEDRENDFSQEIFVSPISRYSIIFGKILGESLVAFPQAGAILVFGVIIGVPMSIPTVVILIPTALVIALFGGAFGVLVLSRLPNRRAAQQIFPFIMLPQFFLAGVFNPLTNLPPFLDILSRIAPMRYAVDLMRGVYGTLHPATGIEPLEPPTTNLAIIAAEFLLFLAFGTVMFVRAERNR
jgi:ABC-2 type transport system permease protein